MSRLHVSSELTRLVETRADRLCGYCLVHENDTFFGCELDHVVAVRHGGPTDAENLAFACLACNRKKGSDLAPFDSQLGGLVRLFNPRTDQWAEHFRLREDGITIEPLTPVGTVTVRILDLNRVTRLDERARLRAEGR